MSLLFLLFFFFNDTATTEIYTYCHTRSLHYALPIWHHDRDGDDTRGVRDRARPDLRICRLAGRRPLLPGLRRGAGEPRYRLRPAGRAAVPGAGGAEDRKSTRLTPVTNAQLVCRLLLEKKKH